MKTIICTKPGMRRAGVEHTARKDWPDDAFTEAQWKLLESDPAFVVVDAKASDAQPAAIEPARLANIQAAIALVPEGENPTVKAVSDLAGFKVTAAEIKAAQDATASADQ